MPKLVAFDFETYWSSKSKYSLTNIGPLSYIRDERFEPLCLGLATKHGAVCLSDPDAVADLDMDDWILVGHNAHGFDALILSEHYDVHPRRIWDTIAMAHWTGVSRISSCSHEAITKLLGNGEKKPGTLVSDGKRKDAFTPEEWEYFTKYCTDDASQCFLNCVAMLPYMTPDSLRFMEITARMATEPGFVVDPIPLRAFLDRLEEEEGVAFERLSKEFALPPDADTIRRTLRSPEKFAGLLRSCGVEPPTKVSEARSRTMGQPVTTYAFAKTDLPFTALLKHDDPRVRLLVKCRLAYNTSMSKSRAETLSKFTGELPVQLACYKAHTSRYTAGSNEGSTAGLQFQHLSKRDADKREIRRAVRAPLGRRVVACDRSQIAARELAWLANDTARALQSRRGEDPYSELASSIFRIPADRIHDGAKRHDPVLTRYRSVGKPAILSAGYGVGARRFSDNLLRQGIRLHDSDEEHDFMAYEAHRIYRETHPAIVRFWQRAESVADALVMGYSGTFAGPDDHVLAFGMEPICDTGVVVPTVTMPSGFGIRYPQLRRTADGLAFDRPKEGEGKTWGGSLVENWCQSLAFQLLMWQACRMDEEGVRLHANIHDSFASVVPESDVDRTVEIMSRCMSMVPDWMPGFPVACEVEVGTDFTIV